MPDDGWLKRATPRVSGLAGLLWLVLASGGYAAEPDDESSPTSALSEVMYLAQVKTRIPDSPWLANRLASDGANAPLELLLIGSQPAALAAALKNTTLVVGDQTPGGLRVRVPSVGTLVAPVTPRHSRSSWVIDFAEPVVDQLVRQQAQADSVSDDRTAWIEALAQFTHAHISRPSYRNGFFIASQVARGQEGDCTEFAVLNAALARGQGHNARVVFGLMLLTTDSGIHAWGHAWTEIYDNEAWVLSDPTLPRLDPSVQGVHYLPLKALENEGPGHFMQLAEFATLRPHEVIVVEEALRLPDAP